MEKPNSNEVRKKFQCTREFTELLTQPLSAEDCAIQSMDDASPTRWHLAHTTWFFETFVLSHESDYQYFDPEFSYLFNSYYNAIGHQFPRSKRGFISRPGLLQVLAYRKYVDEQIAGRLQQPGFCSKYAATIRTGIEHEQQHQELILTDIKHVLACHPSFPKYQALPLDQSFASEQRSAIDIAEGLYQIGHAGPDFAFDNESPRHTAYLHPCRIEAQLATCGEYIEFIEDGGYQRPELWLSAGWASVIEQGWQAPLYWAYRDGGWVQFTLAGLLPVETGHPVTHVSFYEADAFARWRGKRLPTEFEWEVAASKSTIAADDPFVDFLVGQKLAIHPSRSPSGLCGAVWQWTASSYLGYPGYKPPPGAMGEYNGKFMCDQHVLRGGSVATHSSHIRESYRNFFSAHVRWQFSGIRLAESLG